MFRRSLLLAATVSLAAAVIPLALATGAPAPSAAPSGAYQADMPHTSLTWRVSHFGMSHFTARFTHIGATLDWHADAPEQSKLVVNIDPRSVRTDFPFPEQEDFDAKIATDPAFLAGKPIVFTSRRIVVTGPSTGKVEGDLTFRGETHPMTLDVTFNGSMTVHPMEKVAKIGFSAKGIVDRAKWGLDFAVPAVGDAVELQIETEFKPAA